MLFRVVMVTTLLFIATYVEAVSETLLRAPAPLLRHRGDLRADRRSTRWPCACCPARSALAHAQVAGDLLIVTALVLRDRRAS